MVRVTRRTAMVGVAFGFRSVFLTESGRSQVGQQSRSAVNINQLSSIPVFPSLDLYSSLLDHKVRLLGQMSNGIPDASTLNSVANLIHTFADHLDHLGLDKGVKSTAASLIGQPPPSPSEAVIDNVMQIVSQRGGSIDRDKVQQFLMPTHEGHDRGCRLLRKVGVSRAFHGVADIFGAPSSQLAAARAMPVAAPKTLNTPPAHLQYAVEVEVLNHSGARYVEVQTPCPSTPAPANTPPWWCPSSGTLNDLNDAMQAVGAALGTSVASWTGLEFCTVIALEALTADLATDGVGAVATPFEVWPCENSQAIVAAMQTAANAIGGPITLNAIGAVIAGVLYHSLLNFLKSSECTTS